MTDYHHFKWYKKIANNSFFIKLYLIKPFVLKIIYLFLFVGKFVVQPFLWCSSLLTFSMKRLVVITQYVDIPSSLVLLLHLFYVVMKLFSLLFTQIIWVFSKSFKMRLQEVDYKVHQSTASFLNFSIKLATMSSALEAASLLNN